MFVLSTGQKTVSYLYQYLFFGTMCIGLIPFGQYSFVGWFMMPEAEAAVVLTMTVMAAEAAAVAFGGKDFTNRNASPDNCCIICFFLIIHLLLVFLLV